MKTLNDIRQEYPMYNNLSDQDLADRLYDKYYSNYMTKSDFYNRIKFNPEASETTAQKFSSMFVPTVTRDTYGTPNVTPVHSVHPINDVRDIAQGAISSVPKFGQTVVSAASSILPQSVQNNPYLKNIKNFDWTNFTAPIGSGSNGVEASLARGLGSYLPFSEASEVTKPVSLLGKLLKEGGTGAVYGASTGAQGSKKSNSLEDALMNVATRGGAAGLEKLRPSKILSTNLSPEEIENNVYAAGNSPINLGRIISNPYVSKIYENVLSNIPMSGASKNLESVYKESGNKAQDLASKILGSNNIEDIDSAINDHGTKSMKDVLGLDDLEDSGKQLNQKGSNLLDSTFGSFDPESNMFDLNNQLQDVFSERQKYKNSLYDARNKEADSDPNFSMSTYNFQNEANKYKKLLNSSNFLKFDPDFSSLINKLGNFSDADHGESFLLGHNGEKIKVSSAPTLNEASTLKSMLSRTSNSLLSSPDPESRYMSKIFSDLGSSLDKDISTSIDRSGNQNIRQLNDAANENYKKNFLPFLDKDIYKYVSVKADPDKIVSDLLKTGSPEEQATRLYKLSSLSPELNNSVAKTYFNRARNSDGTIDHEKLSGLINSLGKNQFKILVPDVQHQKLLQDFSQESNLHKYFSKAINGNGTLNHDFLNSKIENLNKNPSLFKSLIPSDRSRQQLQSYSKMSNLRNDFKKAFNADGTINAQKFATTGAKIFRNIDSFKNYVPDKSLRKDFQDFQTFQKMTPPSQMFNPETGQKNQAALGLLATLTSPVTNILGANLASKILTSPKVRNNFLKEIKNPRNIFNTDKGISRAQKLAQALTNTSTNKVTK